MAYRLLQINYLGSINNDKSFDQLSSTINTALASIKESGTTVSIQKTLIGITITVSVSDQYKIAQVDTFIESMIDSDFAVEDYHYGFRKGGQ